MNCTWISLNNIMAVEFKYDFLIGWKVIQNLFFGPAWFTSLLYQGFGKSWALFRCENFLNFATVALSFVCGKYYPIRY